MSGAVLRTTGSLSRPDDICCPEETRWLALLRRPLLHGACVTAETIKGSRIKNGIAGEGMIFAGWFS